MNSLTLIMNKVPGNFEKALQLLFAGVAFRTGPTTYEVFSHQGDFIGQLPAYIVQSLVAYARRNLGIEPEWLEAFTPYELTTNSRSVTYGHNPKFSDEDCDMIEQWMNDYFETPFIIR